MEPRLRASPKQFSVIIDFMERHGDLSRPQPGLQGRLKSDRLWQQLTNILNSVGGGVKKPSEKWKKVWADWKAKTKKKYLGLSIQGPSRRIKLSALEERVVANMGVSAAVVGQAAIQEQGFNGTPNETTYDAGGVIKQEILFDVELEEHSENNVVATPPSPATSDVPTQSQPQHNTPHLVLATSALIKPASPPSPSQFPPPLTPPPSYNNCRQASASPRSTATIPRRVLKARRNRGLTPFERAADQFASVEQRRLEHEEARDKRLHEREMERLRLDAERIEVARQHNVLLHQLSLLGQRLIDVITQQPVSSPSTDPL